MAVANPWHILRTEAADAAIRREVRMLDAHVRCQDGRHVVRLSPERDGFEIEIGLPRPEAALFIPHQEAEAAPGGDILRLVHERVSVATAQLRAATLLGLLDSARPLDFTDPAGETALERTERAAVRLAEVAEQLMREVAAMRAREQGAA